MIDGGESMSEHLEKATIGDIILSILLPGWGILIGIIALLKGEGTRGGQMLGLGVLCAIVWKIVTSTV